MYKPRTVEQFKVHLFLKGQFHMNYLTISPVSRTALMLEDLDGDRLAFEWRDNAAVEIPLPVPASKEVQTNFLRAFWADPDHPKLCNFEQLTDWWLSHPTPLTYQQALNLPEDLYRRFLTCERLLYFQEVMELIHRSAVTEEEFRDIQLWYRNGNAAGTWLGPSGVDGDGNSYELVLDWMRPRERRYRFYLMDEYYRDMHKQVPH